MGKVVCLYSESKEKINFKKISAFLKEDLGLLFRVIKLKESIIRTKGLRLDPVSTGKLFEKVRNKKSGIDILLTDKLIATYEETDKRLHLRAAVFGYPSVVSTSGIVEAPAKPREYYLAKQRYSLLKIWELKEDAAKKKFRGRFIDYHDPRLTEVLKGYIGQAVFFRLSGNPFCENKNCRLFNAHWQEDLIAAQIKSGKFCQKHRKVLAGGAQ